MSKGSLHLVHTHVLFIFLKKMTSFCINHFTFSIQVNLFVTLSRTHHRTISKKSFKHLHTHTILLYMTIRITTFSRVLKK